MHVSTRTDRERLEHERLSPEAAKADESRGRARHEAPDDLRTDFQRDRDRILHSKAFRRSKHKTQVFINPEGDHYVTRLTHALQVTQIGRSLAEALGLNADLTEAICLAHDVGHSAFGHIGEEALTPYVAGSWHHAAQSVRVLSVIEPLNLTWEVLDGIRSHSWRIEPPPATPEGMLCRYADRIAYLTHDVEDAIRAGVLAYADVPREAIEVFGEPGRDWIATMLRGVVDRSAAVGKVEMDPALREPMHRLRDFMFDRVYLRPEAEPQKQRAIRIIRDLVEYLINDPDEIPESFRIEGSDVITRAIDYVAGMTDRFAIRTHDRLFRPRLFD
jgi:dGTPase